MQGPTEITFKDVTKTPELEDLINGKIAKLEKICPQMISCRVMVECPQKHPDTGNPHRVRIDVTVPPSQEIVAKQSASEGDMHTPLETVINNTFKAAEKQLKKLSEKEKGQVKIHPEQQVMGIVTKIFADEDYGFIRTVDTGDDVYFHKNSVLHDDYDRLNVGTGVRFVVHMGEKGPQASSVEIEYQPKPGNIA
ncbi:Cold shock-like protein CspB [Anaerohalosphaera lusitana]|uniref:Cold shock-like protein CspB n=1 Tax=Anaerohalosphaera lusitana TaxID=1936003 RepID=A0A1U9NIW1_9BACT|nr:HPF/RaiA family ribosome-associated protein [Anaerohalosphaera lusitana]AQT67872.1 Cold shock-like protein CspB [Anaerohalosphaera lusitana]